MPECSARKPAVGSVDNRCEARTITLHRVSAIEAGMRRGLCVIKKLSPWGAMIHTVFNLSVDEALTLVMVSGARIKGRVRWISDILIGIEFDMLTPLSTVLDRGDSKFGNGGRRMPRLAVAAPVRVKNRDGVKMAVIHDISLNGARLSCTDQIGIGPVTIEPLHLRPVSARVLWTISGQAGCVFERPFEIDELTNWVGMIG